TTQLRPQLCSHAPELLQVSEHALAHCWLHPPFPDPLPLQVQFPPSQTQVPPPSALHSAGPPRAGPQVHPLPSASAPSRPSITDRIACPLEEDSEAVQPV